MLENNLIEKKVSYARHICGNIPPSPVRYRTDVKIPVMLNPSVLDSSVESILIHRICWDLIEFCSSGCIRGIAAFYPATFVIDLHLCILRFQTKQKNRNFHLLLSIIRHFQQIFEVH